MFNRNSYNLLYSKCLIYWKIECRFLYKYFFNKQRNETHSCTQFVKMSLTKLYIYKYLLKFI